MLFGIGMLALGIWDAAILQFHPLRGPLIFVGMVLSAAMLGLLIWKERAERSQNELATALLKDAELGKFQRIRISPIASSWIVTDIGELEPGYLIRSEQQVCYLAGDHVLDAIEEYRRSLAADDAAASRWQLATEILVEQWPQSRRVRLVELTGATALLQPFEIPLTQFLPHLPNGNREEFAILPENALQLPISEPPTSPSQEA